MLEVMTEKAGIENALRKFRKRVAFISGKPVNVKWSFPSGNSVVSQTYSFQSGRGEIRMGFPGIWDGRAVHLFALDPKGNSLVPDVEVNIPLKLDRRVSGVCARNGDEIWLCTRGRFTSHRNPIPVMKTFSHFQPWLVDMIDVDRKTQVIPVAALEDRNLANDIGEFVNAVLALHSSLGSDAGQGNEAETSWKEGTEFEGKKSKINEAGTSVYDYEHGPICNSLRDLLKSLLAGQSRYVVRRNKNVDIAIVDTTGDVAVAIFEIKTSSSLSTQLYKAVGQLMYYRQRYGIPVTGMFLVLPKECITDGFPSRSALLALGIRVIVRTGAQFADLKGRSMADVLKGYL